MPTGLNERNVGRSICPGFGKSAYGTSLAKTSETILETSEWASVLSGVPQGTVLGPSLFSLYINVISKDIDSERRLFADDCVCYGEIRNTDDSLKLQKDIERLGCWARKWGRRFRPVKCNIMQITRKRTNKIEASLHFRGYSPRKCRFH